MRREGVQIRLRIPIVVQRGEVSQRFKHYRVNSRRTFGKHVVLGVIDVHSYGQLIMYPYGWSEKPCPHEAFMKAVVESMSMAIKRATLAKYMPCPHQGLYPNSGSSMDWYYETAFQTSIPVYSLAMELDPGMMCMEDFRCIPRRLQIVGKTFGLG